MFLVDMERSFTIVPGLRMSDLFANRHQIHSCIRDDVTVRILGSEYEWWERCLETAAAAVLALQVK